MNLGAILIEALIGGFVLSLMAIVIDDHIAAWWKGRKK